MLVKDFLAYLDSDFYTGVPDSQLKALCDYLMDEYGIDREHHIIAANEGNCTALAAGYHLATGKIPVVYMQNSGEGNIINPIASLLNEEVYGIPVIFIIGWRGEPGIHDEPQHVYQGKGTTVLLEDMDIPYFVLSKDTTECNIQTAMKKFSSELAKGKSVAFVVKKGALEFSKKVEYKNDYTMQREDVIKHIALISQKDPIISTTGKASRELFEIREICQQEHKFDFLTVGSMGHASSIAMGVAINQPLKKIWCIDGDGAVLMHMGAMPVLASVKLDNFVHVIINNGAHETVGGMNTVAKDIDIVGIAKACGYDYAISVDNFVDLDLELRKAKDYKGLFLLEVKCSIGARNDLGRPTTSAKENKENFMRFLQEL